MPSLSADDMSAVADALASQGALIFGRADGCLYSRALATEWAAAIESGRLPFIACDASPEARALCTDVGISMTPSLLVGGSLIKGYLSPAQMADVATIAPKTAARLASRGAVLYGRDGCTWTARQKQALGQAMSSVTYVNCDAHEARCASAGVKDAVPAWEIDGSAPIFGYRPMSELSRLAAADGNTLAAEAAASAAALAKATAKTV